MTHSPTVRRRRRLFGIGIDAIRMPEAVDRIKSWIDDSENISGQENSAARCRYVVTPNVDHTVLLQENELFRQVYENADLILADGHPIVWASRLLGRPLPERVAGSDLVPQLLAAKHDQELRVFLLGAAPGVGRRAADAIHEQFENVVVTGVHSPPLGFEKDKVENEKILDQITVAKPDLLVVGLGAPKQELWVHQHCERIPAKVALCVGATIDFMAGEKKRAPRWMRSAGIEWVHRICSEPKRLAKRYAKDAWIFPQLVFRQWRVNRKSS